MNALERTLAARRHELVSKETRRRERGEAKGIQERDCAERRKRDVELGIRMLSHTANVRAQDGGGVGGEGER